LPFQSQDQEEKDDTPYAIRYPEVSSVFAVKSLRAGDRGPYITERMVVFVVLGLVVDPAAVGGNEEPKKGEAEYDFHMNAIMKLAVCQ